ncbi:MAG: hypothetical protein WBG48_00560 [Pricia sp.]
MLDFLKRTKITPEKKFWNWILENKDGLKKFIASDHSDLRIYNKLTKEMQKYNSLLFPEMTMTKDNECVLIITPDGMPEGVSPTQKLYSEKPEIKNWIIKKFRQPTDESDLNYNGIAFPSSDVRILPIEKDLEKGIIHIKVFVRNLDSDLQNYRTLAWLYLNHILGEFNTITKVGVLEFLNLEKDIDVKGAISILELRELIEKELY